MEKLVSIIIPVYNTAGLKDCVKSVLGSLYRNIEVLVVDDGSEPGIAAICDLLAAKDERIKVIHRENGGVSSARNCGLEQAKGEFIAFADADDLMDEKIISILVDNIEGCNADMAVCGHFEVYDGGRYTIPKCPASSAILDDKTILTEFFTTGNIGWHVWAKLYRKKLIEDIRFPEEIRIAEDMFFNYNALKKASRVAMVKEPLYSYIKNTSSAMADGNVKNFFGSFYLMRAVYDDIDTDSMKREKKLFYIKNGLFFFRLIFQKKGFVPVCDEMEKERRIFLETIGTQLEDCTLRMRAELFLLKNAPKQFRLYAKYSWGIRRKYI